ncbi:MAG: hypothetical protein R3351_03025 [Nitrospirales bacterium]|nr:hypothetical protein [Nitrospirales bacterium]
MNACGAVKKNFLGTVMLTALVVTPAMLGSPFAMTEEEKESLITNSDLSSVESHASSALIAPAALTASVLGDGTSFQSPAIPLPATTTPHDGNNTNDGG